MEKLQYEMGGTVFLFACGDLGRVWATYIAVKWEHLFSVSKRKLTQHYYVRAKMLTDV